ncbi:dihydropteroate synthase [Terrimonas rubra]|uniref:dihydropteroate synthase n=1 Tax=Terrimonas rubra TaxID=1035890 RepID=A0ABW6AAK0_9BACT
MITLNCKGRLLVLEKPVVMGIINTTPDSFFEGSRHHALQEIVDTAGKMIHDGATILDIGGQSTRPGSQQVSAPEELERTGPAIEAIRKHFPGSFISIDTYYSAVAREAVRLGADIVNDISAGSIDADLLPVVAALNVPYILMHMQGTPATMQQQPQYGHVVQEVLQFLITKKAVLQDAGIKDIIIDPGFGFGKTIQHNLQLLKQLHSFTMLDSALLAGLSRKSTVYKTLGITADQALNGTTALNMLALNNGANILRVHDVKEAVECVKLFEAYRIA